MRTYATKAQNDLNATIRDLRRAYRKGDPLLIVAIHNARLQFLSTKRAVKETRSKLRLDHWVGHALSKRPDKNGQIKLRGYCKHTIKGAR